jgi:hypothetical protein
MTTNTEGPATLHLSLDGESSRQESTSIPVNWTLSGGLVAQLRAKGFVYPHMLIVVASERDETMGKQHYAHYQATSVYIAEINAKKPSREWVSFSRPGKNIITATVIDIRGPKDAQRLRNIKKNPGSLSFSGSTLDWSNYGQLRGIVHLRARSYKRITVEPEFFAKPPPTWLKQIVKQFFPSSEFDQCHFRKRALISVFLLTPLVQFYGIFARLGILIAGLFMASRGLTIRNIFSLRPHDFARRLGSSFWFTNKNGSDRHGVLPWVSPPALAIYVALAAIASIPAFLYLTIKQEIETGGSDTPFNVSVGEFILTALVLDVIIAAFCFICWGLFNKNGRGTVRSWIDTLSHRFGASVREARVTTDQYSDLLTVPSNSAHTDDTFHLWFRATKAKVCKTFALPYS